MTEHLMITSLPKVFKTLLFVCQFWSLALVAMVRQPKVLLMIIHSLLWLCSNISQRLFVCCIFECSDHLTSGGCIALHWCRDPNVDNFPSSQKSPKVAWNQNCWTNVQWEWVGGRGGGSRRVFRTGFCYLLMIAILFHNRSWCECGRSSTEVQLVIWYSKVQI